MGIELHFIHNLIHQNAWGKEKEGPALGGKHYIFSEREATLAEGFVGCSRELPTINMYLEEKSRRSYLKNLILVLLLLCLSDM